MNEIYSTFKQSTFAIAARDRSVKASTSNPRATFHFDREYNDTSPFILYDFVVDLNQIVGTPIELIEVKDGCIIATISLDSPQDYLGRDFRFLVLTDRELQYIFATYGVDTIYFQNFPEPPGSTTRPNLDWNRFKLDEFGKPSPI